MRMCEMLIVYGKQDGFARFINDKSETISCNIRFNKIGMEF
jgi:hypothetical protein